MSDGEDTCSSLKLPSPRISPEETVVKRETSRATTALAVLSRYGRRYGPAHRRLRALWASRVAAGVVECARCGEMILAGDAWDLGHVDGTLSYAGPEHARCNRAAAGRWSGRIW